jgi:hypothetical protein
MTYVVANVVDRHKTAAGEDSKQDDQYPKVNVAQELEPGYLQLVRMGRGLLLEAVLFGANVSWHRLAGEQRGPLILNIVARDGRRLGRRACVKTQLRIRIKTDCSPSSGLGAGSVTLGRHSVDLRIILESRPGRSSSDVARAWYASPVGTVTKKTGKKMREKVPSARRSRYLDVLLGNNSAETEVKKKALRPNAARGNAVAVPRW